MFSFLFLQQGSRVEDIRRGNIKYSDMHGSYRGHNVEPLFLEIERLNKERNATCEWELFDIDTNAYDTQCGNAFLMSDGTPAENQMAFCCYCGLKIKVD